MMAARRVLLIDDNDEHRRMLGSSLRARGWSVELARTGREGLDVAARVQPDVVVTELILPDVRGFQFGRSLRSMIEHDIVVIAVTRIGEELHGRALEAGFDHVLRKPLDLEELQRRMTPQPLPHAS
jgi:DNA-binding response OmpR family regulator